MSNIAFSLNFLIMGIWHGIEVYYILYGLYHAVLFIGYGYYEKWRKNIRQNGQINLRHY